MNHFELWKQRGGRLFAALVVAVSMVGCATLDAQPSIEYNTADDNCPACGATPEQTCKCRPDTLLGGYKPTKWTTYDEPNVVYRQFAHTAPNQNQMPQQQTSAVAARQPVMLESPQHSSAALLAAQPTPEASQTGAEQLMALPEVTLAQQTAPLANPRVESLEDEFALLASGRMGTSTPEMLLGTEPSTLAEILSAEASPLELGTPIQANPLGDIQLVAYDEELPAELLLDGAAPVPAFSTTSGHATIHHMHGTLHDGCQTCRDCGLKGRLGDLSWLRRHRCAAAPRDWCYRVKHWRPMLLDRWIEGKAGCAAGSCGPCTDCVPAVGHFKSLPAAPPQLTGETHFIAHGDIDAGCDTCSPIAQCTSCRPGVQMLGKLRTSIQQRPVLGAVFGHGHHCAGPPDAACYGYHATHWRQMGEECNIPHRGYSHAMPHGPVEIYPMPEEVERPQPSPPTSPLELPPELTPPAERPPSQPAPSQPAPSQPLPPSEIPDLFPERSEPQPTRPMPTTPAEPEPSEPVPSAPEVIPDEIPDLFPQRAPSAEEPPGMVKFNTRWRPATSQPNVPKQSEPQPLEDEETAVRPIRPTSATQLPGQRPELRFLPNKWVSPIAPVNHDESLDRQP